MKKIALSFIFISIATGTILFFFNMQKDQEIRSAVPKMHQISLFHYFSGSLSGGLTEMINTVNSRDPNQQVLAQSLNHEAFKSMIHMTLAKGNPPELFTYWAGAKTQELVNQGKLEPLDDIWQTVPLTNRFTTPVTEAASTYNGKKYLLPISQHVVVFFYNKQLLEREGLTSPATWEELVNLAEELKNRQYTPFALGAKERWPAQFWFDYLLLRTAGPTYRQNLMEGKAAYTDPQVQKVYEMWGSLLQKGYFNANANDLDWAEATQTVCSGDAAMTLMGSWAIQALATEKCGLPEETGFDFFAFPMISPGVPKIALGPVDGIVLTKDSANHTFAKTILSYFSEVLPQQKLSIGSGGFAPSSQVLKTSYSPLRRRILAESESSAQWAFNYDLATASEIADKGMDSFNELIAFPDQSAKILEHLQTEVSRIRQTK
ncbi:MAG: extracellular solute-binding protein [Proteobacteria bacterium]|nr:extracellular solute-binding protein [Pseudomonadota bacterium]